MNMEVGKIVADSIRELYSIDENAKSFFDWAASRKNDAAETSVDRISEVVGISRGLANELAKAICEAGCGDYIVGRKGWKTRVRWNFSLRSLGATATTGVSRLEEIDPELQADVTDQVGGSVPDVASGGQRLTVADAKKRLAETFGVSPEAIEITIRA